MKQKYLFLFPHQYWKNPQDFKDCTLEIVLECRNCYKFKPLKEFDKNVCDGDICKFCNRPGVFEPS